MQNPLSQKILFLKVKNQDPEAFGQFYDLYVSRIYRFIFFKVNSAADAQDLTSEVFLRFWQYLKQEGRKVKSLNSLIYAIARNLVVDFYREKGRAPQPVDVESGLSDIIDEGQDLFSRQLLNSDMKAVSLALGQLKDEYKEVIVLRFLDELSIAEIAEVLDKSQGSVRVLTHRALKALKDTMERP